MFSSTFTLAPSPTFWYNGLKEYFMVRKFTPSDNEKVAIKIAKLLNDLTLDLDAVGIYLGRQAPSVSYRRLQIIAEAAEAEREQQDVRLGHNPLF